jgi:hypothetical protein
MKREILFRAKTVYIEHDWVEGYYTKAYDTTGDIPTVPIIEDENGGWDEIDPETLGQFTGLYDKNGKKIFEGDIVKLPLSKKSCKVTFKSGGFVAEYGSYGFTVNNSLYGGNLEVIGNIYDNPELVEQEGER